MIRCCASITGASCSSKAKRRILAILSWISPVELLVRGLTCCSAPP